MIERNYSKLIGFLIFLTFDLMLLGAAVRALDAGLACPDWPLCFGKVLPKYDLQVYLEVIHRFIAGFVALVFFVAYAAAFIYPRLKPLRLTLSVGLLLLFAQIVMGGLTVLKILEPGIVTAHLSLATAFLISLVVVQHQVEGSRFKVLKNPTFEKLSLVGVILVCAQIVLGGWVASNYAGMACVDFPLCNGQWFPAWTGPIGAQVIHRLTAYTLATFFVVYFFYALKAASKGQIALVQKKTAFQCLLLIFSQITVGVLNLQMQIPAWMTVLHLGLALYLLLTILRVNLLHIFSNKD
jgi:cytochrome c oxidase assembly protein subunit 15